MHTMRGAIGGYSLFLGGGVKCGRVAGKNSARTCSQYRSSTVMIKGCDINATSYVSVVSHRLSHYKLSLMR